LRYSLLYTGKDCFNIGMIDLPAAPGVFRHILSAAVCHPYRGA
jgi:hypothetical protein